MLLHSNQALTKKMKLPFFGALVANDFVPKNSPSVALVTQSGLSTKKMATFIFDTAAKDINGVSNKTVAAHPMGVYIPANAIITKVTFQTKTGFTSVNSTAKIALTAVTAADLFAAVAISNGDFSGAAFVAGIQDGTVTNYLSAGTSVRNLTVNVSVEALTAGKLIGFVEY